MVSRNREVLYPELQQRSWEAAKSLAVGRWGGGEKSDGGETERL